MLPEPYATFRRQLLAAIPAERIIDDPLGTLAYGTDASFYRLIPKLVVRAENEAEVIRVLKGAHDLKLPVTFRAAGTSLSGQAITDSILLVAGSSWKRFEILEGGERIRLQPGIIGAHANRFLAPFGRKIGPDPASINAAMIGGIAANNASGMCCGTAQNSYRTVAGMRLILGDGTLLDTADAESRAAFGRSHAALLAELAEMGRSVRADTALCERIRQKFKIKNTVGYSLNALVDFKDPFDILEHLMIGSEGTLGFIAEITYRTVIEHPFKASALMVFGDIETACNAVPLIRQTPVAAVELMDRAALRSVESKAGMPAYLKTLPPGATALLVETRAGDQATLDSQVAAIIAALADVPTETPVAFTDRPAEYTLLWNIRKGLFPAVGAVRRTGTTVIIEDVAFPLERLAAATLELQELMTRFGYHEAIIFGHALEGNLHFVFTQDFGPPEEVERYRRFMDAVCAMVVARYDGSLKGEHGTGRNMAPFVEMEWGAEAYHLMQDIKSVFDPHGLLNPGVILNPSPRAHVEHLKPLPATHPLVDRCIECGFCEATCPSRNLTLTPRQRIAARREISRLQSTGENPARQAALSRAYVYAGEQTCAVDGLCGVACPVEINTGALTKELRGLNAQRPAVRKTADWVADHFSAATALTRAGLRAAHGIHHLLGTQAMTTVTGKARAISANRLPLWNRYMPRDVSGPRPSRSRGGGELKVVYFPSCISRTMGPAAGDPDHLPLYTVTARVLQKAGYEVISPPGMARLCCGTPFDSKGLKQQADRKAAELEGALLDASRGGAYPVLCDTSPCLYRMKQVMSPLLRLFEPVEFVHDVLMGLLDFSPLPETVAIHNTCSAIKMGLESKFRKVAEACAAKVVVPEGVSCCGFAGDRGFHYPELNAAALAELSAAVTGTCSAGYSNSRTCEIGLSLHSGIYYKSILYLVDRCTRPAH